MAEQTILSSQAPLSLEQCRANEFYYQQGWFDLLARLYGYRISSLTTKDAAGRVNGYLPLSVVRSPISGTHVVGLPFSDHCPLLAEHEESAASLIEQAIEVARREKARYLELRSGSNSLLAARDDLHAGNLYVRWYLPLAADPTSIWTGLRKPVQRQIKKSQNMGVQVRLAERREDMLLYHRLHLQTRSRHGMPAQSKRFFLGLWDAFAAKEQVQLLLAEYQNEVIAGMVLLLCGNTVRYAYGASDERFLNLSPNNLLMWKAIELGCTRGYQVLDMGRTATENTGLMEFKRRWGTIQEPLPYYYYPDMQGLASTSEGSAKYKLLTSCWKRLPLPVAERLGNVLYKHLG